MLPRRDIVQSSPGWMTHGWQPLTASRRVCFLSSHRCSSGWCYRRWSNVVRIDAECPKV